MLPAQPQRDLPADSGIADAPQVPYAETHVDPKASARAAHLRYVSDLKPGIRREQGADGVFRYFAADGAAIADEATLTRIQSLGIPPAYTDVWICPIPNGHLQATGRDARGRKQYRYHPRWRTVRDAAKYDRMLAFGEALPRIRARIDADLSRRGLPREKVVAAVVHLLEKTRIRVGNEEYAQANASYGLTTMHNEHVAVEGSTLHFHFRGKSGKEHDIALRDPRAARVVAQCLDLPGQELFQYVDADGNVHHIDSGDVNDYLREASGEEFTAKDFRTWAGTVLCALCLAECETPSSAHAAKHAVADAIKRVSAQLGNTPAICRKCYVHPAVIESYGDGTMARSLLLSSDKKTPTTHETDLSPDEAAVLHFLEHQLHPAK